MSVSISRFFDGLRKKQVVFIGVGVSHTRLIEKFLDKGIAVTVCDRRSAEQMGETYSFLLEKGARFRLPHARDVFQLPRPQRGPEKG